MGISSGSITKVNALWVWEAYCIHCSFFHFMEYRKEQTSDNGQDNAWLIGHQAFTNTSESRCMSSQQNKNNWITTYCDNFCDNNSDNH